MKKTLYILIVIYIFTGSFLLLYLGHENKYFFLLLLYISCWFAFSSTREYFDFKNPYRRLLYATSISDKNERFKYYCFDMLVVFVIFPILTIYGIVKN